MLPKFKNVQVGRVPGRNVPATDGKGRSRNLKYSVWIHWMEIFRNLNGK